jgi:hypothetical protein
MYDCKALRLRATGEITKPRAIRRTGNGRLSGDPQWRIDVWQHAVSASLTLTCCLDERFTCVFSGQHDQARNTAAYIL